MRAHGVVDPLPGAGLTVEHGDVEVAEGAEFVELLGMGALGALDRGVEPGRTGRSHEQVPLDSGQDAGWASSFSRLKTR